MSAREVRVERLLGRRVRATNGRVVGRIEEIRAEKRGQAHVVAGYELGEAGWLERMGLGRLLGRREGRLARWDQLDLSDPERPRLTCTVSELERFRPDA